VQVGPRATRSFGPSKCLDRPNRKVWRNRRPTRRASSKSRFQRDSHKPKLQENCVQRSVHTCDGRENQEKHAATASWKNPPTNRGAYSPAQSKLPCNTKRPPLSLELPLAPALGGLPRSLQTCRMRDAAKQHLAKRSKTGRDKSCRTILLTIETTWQKRTHRDARAERGRSKA
jgi:hypothetical protein